METFWTAQWWALPAWMIGVLVLVGLLIRTRRSADPTSQRAGRRLAVRWQLQLLVAFVLILLFVLGR